MNDERFLIHLAENTHKVIVGQDRCLDALCRVMHTLGTLVPAAH